MIYILKAIYNPKKKRTDYILNLDKSNNFYISDCEIDSCENSKILLDMSANTPLYNPLTEHNFYHAMADVAFKRKDKNLLLKAIAKMKFEEDRTHYKNKLKELL